MSEGTITKQRAANKQGGSSTRVFLVIFLAFQFVFLSLYQNNSTLLMLQQSLPFDAMITRLNNNQMMVSSNTNQTSVLLAPSPVVAAASVVEQKKDDSSSHHDEPLSLDELTVLPPPEERTCGEFTFFTLNQVTNNNNSNPSRTGSGDDYHIPRIVHQTSRTRCIVKEFGEGADKWKGLDGGNKWNYYFHDDAAMERIVQSSSTSTAFPNLKLVWNNCVTQGAMKADLWRLLVLWEYGGIFSDLDSSPNHFDGTTIQPTDDAVFVVDMDGLASFHFMAMAPKHPLLFITLQSAIHNLLNAVDTGKMNPVKFTGPAALRSAIYQHIQLGGGDFGSMEYGAQKVTPGEYTGVGGRKIRILATPPKANRDYWVVRETAGPVRKQKHYHFMNMTHFTQDMKKKSGVSCMTKIMQNLLEEESSSSRSQ